MKVPDDILKNFFHLTTDMDESDYKEHLVSDIRKAHFVYANEIVTIYWGKEALIEAERHYLEVASGGVPDIIDTISIHASSISIVDLVRTVGFAPSNSEARRLILGRGIKINNEVVVSLDLLIEAKTELVLSKGKNKFVKITVSN